MRQHFYVGSDDEAERCRESVQFGKLIAIGGTDTMTGRIKSYSGIVLAIEASSSEAPGERWRITIDAR